MCATCGPCCILLCRLPDIGAIQVAALLNVARVRRNDGIGQTQKTLCNDSGYFETIEVLPTHLAQNPMQRMLDLLCSQRAKNHYFHFRRDKKEIPSRGANLAIESETIERLDHAPVARVGRTLQALAWKAQKRWPLRHQDRADLNFLGHGRLLVQGLDSGGTGNRPGWTLPST